MNQATLSLLVFLFGLPVLYVIYDKIADGAERRREKKAAERRKIAEEKADERKKEINAGSGSSDFAGTIDVLHDIANGRK